jgi:cytochrome c oxidase subunit 2
MSERNNQTGQVVALIALFVAVMIFTIGGYLYRPWMPPAASAHGAGMDALIRYLLWTTGVIFVLGHVILIWFIWKYARGQTSLSPVTSNRTERLWSVAPIVAMAVVAEGGVLVMGLPVWEQIYGHEPENPEVVEVTARQFEWLFRYPGPDGEFGRVVPELVDGQSNPVGLDGDDPAGSDDIVVRNRIHLPIDRTAVLLLRSHDVLHSWSVPAFRSKQDIIPGIVGSTQFTPIVEGEFEIGCAELCGLAHYRMRGTVIVHSESDYAAWLQEQGGQQ